MINFLKRVFVRVRDMLASMRVRYIFLILFGSALATISFMICHSAITYYIENIYTSQEVRVEREIEYVEDLQNFITTNKVTYDSVDDISHWVRDNPFVYLLIYKDDEIIFRPDQSEPPMDDEDGDGVQDGTDTETIPPQGDTPSTDKPQSGGITISYPTKEELYQYALSGENYPLILADGALSCTLTEFTEYMYYDMANIISLGVAIVVLAAALISYFYAVTSRIARLARDVSTVSRGAMNHTIRAGQGYDEISKLCQNVEHMRASIVYTLQKEREAVNANAELITSLSHDIRTPLTVLLGYLDIMKMQTGDEAMKQYIVSAEQTALRLKNLSDEMFQYFLVFAGDENRSMCEEYDAETLLSQLFSEHGVLLAESGFEMIQHCEEGLFSTSPIVVTNAPGCMRIVDNLYSNFKKYADPCEPIHFYMSEDEEWVYIRFENKIREDTDEVESTGIGLKTCDRIARNLGMRFEVKSEEDTFVISIAIPKGKAEGEEDV